MLIVFCIASLVLGLVICLLAGGQRPWVAQVSYVAALLASLITASKISPMVDGVYVSVAVGFYSMTFLLTDFLGEIHGRDAALRAVKMGFVAALVMVFGVYFAIHVDPAPFWVNQEAFNTVLAAAPRILIASVLAFVAAQLADVLIFDFLKKKSNGKYLALRNNVSTFVGQTIDSAIFYTIAFWGVAPNLFELIWVTCIVKYIIAIFDTPMLYLARYAVGKQERIHASRRRVETTT